MSKFRLLGQRSFRILQHEDETPKGDVDTAVEPQAFVARQRARDDEKAGHDAADYWRGWAAGSFLASNKGLERTPLRITGHY